MIYLLHVDSKVSRFICVNCFEELRCKMCLDMFSCKLVFFFLIRLLMDSANKPVFLTWGLILGLSKFEVNIFTEHITPAESVRLISWFYFWQRWRLVALSSELHIYLSLDWTMKTCTAYYFSRFFLIPSFYTTESLLFSVCQLCQLCF